MTSKKGNLHIIISDNIADMIDIVKIPRVSIHSTENVIQKMLSLTSKPGKSGLKVLFFLSPELVKEVSKSIESLDGDLPLYRIAVIDSTGEYPLKKIKNDSIITLRYSRITAPELKFLAEQVCREIAENERLLLKYREAVNTLNDSRNDQEDLINIGKSLSLEKDPDRLLRIILLLSQKITGCDAGSIFLIEENEEGVKSLRFKYTNTYSLKNTGTFEEFTMPLDTNSIGGYVGVTGKVLNIPDVYLLSSNDPVSFNKSYDKKTGYRTKSMLVVPMRGNQDRLIGVIQLINSKESASIPAENEADHIALDTPEDFENKVFPFHKRYESLMEAVAGQAAISLENSRMFRQIEFQFEEFVKASVTAIESRDPATSGHSFRVAAMCVNAVRAINKVKKGLFADVNFSDIQCKELEFAALLHDFGKVYIDAAVFLKAKKLFPQDYNLLLMRLQFLRRSLELLYYGDEKKKLRELKIKSVNDIIELVKNLNEPSLQAEPPEDIIKKILDMQEELSCTDFENNIIPLLTEREHTNLLIRKGSLNNEERAIIESHVDHTYTFVSRIPWPEEFKNIPEISAKHHEMLDGTGYPNGLSKDDNFPIQARIMAIADIFDALSASDRPYKKSIPLDKICSIMKEEADRGKLDSGLVELFIKKKLWEDK